MENLFFEKNSWIYALQKSRNLNMRYLLLFSFSLIIASHFIMGKREICGFLYLSESPIYATVKVEDRK